MSLVPGGISWGEGQLSRASYSGRIYSRKKLRVKRAWGNCPGGSFMGVSSPGGNCLGGKLFRGNYPEGKSPESNFLRGIL